MHASSATAWVYEEALGPKAEALYVCAHMEKKLCVSDRCSGVCRRVCSSTRRGPHGSGLRVYRYTRVRVGQVTWPHLPHRFLALSLPQCPHDARVRLFSFEGPSGAKSLADTYDWVKPSEGSGNEQPRAIDSDCFAHCLNQAPQAGFFSESAASNFCALASSTRNRSLTALEGCCRQPGLVSCQGCRDALLSSAGLRWRKPQHT